MRDGDGRGCTVQPDPASSNAWVVAHTPGAMLNASYELRPAKPDPLADFKTHYEPVVRDDLFHLIGETALLFPEWLDGAKPVDIGVSWTGLKERGWKTATSFDHEGARVRHPLGEFRHAMFCAGRIRTEDRNIRGGLLRVAIYGDDWLFQDRELVNLVERIVTAEREFVDDFGDPYFLVTIVPTGARATPQSFSLAGTGLTNCFALFLPPGTAIVPGSTQRLDILRLLAHEYFHTWNGGKIRMQEPEELVYWFSEGFTDFYASRVLRHAGLIDDAEWVRRLNETLKNLWLSPVATQPADTIRREFWSRPEVNKLPYHRGEVVALMLDEEIRSVTAGARTLDDFMRELLADARHGERSETGRLLSRIARWTTPNVAEAIRRIVVDGALPSPPAHVTVPAATRYDVNERRFIPGLNIDETIGRMVVTGVDRESAAYAAGLRDGQTVEGFSIHRGDPDREAELKIREGGRRRAIRFFPRGDAVLVPAYRLDRSARAYPLFEEKSNEKQPAK